MDFRYASYALTPSIDVYVGRPSSNPIIGLVGGIAESVVAGSLDTKLVSIMSPKELAEIMSRETEGVLRVEFRVDDSIRKAPSYLVETILDDYQLVSNPDGSYIRIKGISRLRYRQTNEVLWSKDMENYITLSENSSSDPSPSFGATVTGVTNAVSLLSEDDYKLKNRLKTVAQEVVEYLAYSLVDDYVESRK